MLKKLSDQELMKILEINAKTLDIFKNIQKQTIKDAKKLFAQKKGKIKVLGISGSARLLRIAEKTGRKLFWVCPTLFMPTVF